MLFLPLLFGTVIEAQAVLQGAGDYEYSSFIDDIFGEVAGAEALTDRNQQIQLGQLSLSVESPVSASSIFRDNKLHLPDNDDLSDFTKYIPLYSGIVTFAHIEQADCFFDPDTKIDVAIVGAPFDSGVSYIPGARFGPNGVRQGSRRLGGGLNPIRGNTPDSKLRKLDPYHSGLKIVDCGDVPMTPFDARVALNQLYRGERAIHKHRTATSHYDNTRIISLGGDHTTTLMNLRSAYESFGNDSLAVIHFDAHIDTWDPEVLGGGISKYAGLNHGTFLHYASELGYVAKNHSIHVGIRAPYITEGDIKHDRDCGFQKITSKDVDILTPRGVGRKIKEVVGDRKVYLTFDLDTFDISYINSGTLEAAGLNSREVLTILDELEGIDLVGCDIVEVNTPPNSVGLDNTGLLAAQVVDSLLGLMVVTDVN
ncbi:DEKNAAC103959 [Brettanomyces naardenensis]|uniref:DEKNAAC103959 n=1 Tax=Brettanomyces naardenensis TaxID=13370 RepID=A0A448YPU1_BRENA|nr:DEKNAAC103959 [Brettanomyces naardenensis]